MKFRKPAGTQPLDNEEGFALIEGMVATAVFAITMAAMAFLLTKSASTNFLSRSVTSQTLNAANMVEDLTPIPYVDGEWDDGGHPDRVEGIYTLAYNVQEDTLLNNTKKVTVTVTWRQPSGEIQTVVIDHIKPDNI